MSISMLTTTKKAAWRRGDATPAWPLHLARPAALGRAARALDF